MRPRGPTKVFQNNDYKHENPSGLKLEIKSKPNVQMKLN